MNVLFLSLEVFGSIYDSNMYTDILREFMKNGHNVYSVSPIERRHNGRTELICEDNSALLRLRIGNIQKTNLIEKGISTLLIEKQYINGIKKYFENIKFDLILYATPPITFCNVIEYVKKRDGAISYLMLKDIFPQNAVDLGMFKKSGWTSIIYKYFRYKEKNLYKISDKIGCMSEENKIYVLKNNICVSSSKVEICPNCIEVVDKGVDIDIKKKIRTKYKIPLDKKVFVYGGNLGKPQGIPFLIECLKSQCLNNDVFFLVVGDGTEYSVLEQYYNNSNQKNFRLMRRMPKEDYDILVSACDIGLLFLDHRFTIPNFPSRLLSYMQSRLPVLACTDPITDVGKVAVEGNFGWWCESNSVSDFDNTVKEIMNSNLKEKGNNAFVYLKEHYSADVAYKVIMKELD